MTYSIYENYIKIIRKAGSGSVDAHGAHGNGDPRSLRRGSRMMDNDTYIPRYLPMYGPSNGFKTCCEVLGARYFPVDLT